jgi:serine/threonine protein phosphatase PrpC
MKDRPHPPGGRGADSTSVLLGRMEPGEVSDRSLYLDAAGESEVGRARRLNQDTYRISSLRDNPSQDLVEPPREARPSPLAAGPVRLLTVADGIGGAPVGERASLQAVDSFHSFLEDQRDFLRQDRREGLMIEFLSLAVDRCQADLASEVKRHPEWLGMGTTLTSAVLVGSRMYVVHAGDSKCYLYRDSVLRQVTHDHTQAHYLAEAGVLAPDMVRSSRLKHIVWNTLGSTHYDVQPEIVVETLHAGDILLLCTDGVTDQVTDDELRALLSTGHPSRILCRNVMNLARKNKASDDITVIVGRLEALPGEARDS